MESNNKMLSILLIGFVVLILGAALTDTLATTTKEKTNNIQIANETLDISSLREPGSFINSSKTVSVSNTYTSGWLTTSDLPATCQIDTNAVLLNQTNGLVVSGIDFNVTSLGVVTIYNTDLVNQSAANNQTFISYTYCSDGYLKSAWSRTVLNLNPGFFVLALLAVAIFIFYAAKREWGD